MIWSPAFLGPRGTTYEEMRQAARQEDPLIFRFCLSTFAPIRTYKRLFSQTL